MKLKCRLGLHRPINDFSCWQDGFNISACADCGTEMTKPRGAKWEAIKRADR
jgi:hypothetical protein